MAAKVKMLKLLQEIRGFAAITNRRPAPRSPGLVLAQIRTQGMQDSLRRTKLSITINQQSQPDIPHRVRINYVKPGLGSAAMPPAP